MYAGDQLRSPGVTRPAQRASFCWTDFALQKALLGQRNHEYLRSCSSEMAQRKIDFAENLDEVEFVSKLYAILAIWLLINLLIVLALMRRPKSSATHQRSRTRSTTGPRPDRPSGK